MKLLYQAIRAVEKKRRHPVKDRPLSQKTLRAIAKIIEMDKHLDSLERSNE